MTDPEHVALIRKNIAESRDLLAEASRYLQNLDETKRLLRAANELFKQIQESCKVLSADFGTNFTKAVALGADAYRKILDIQTNLCYGIVFLRQDPDVLRCFLYTSRHQLLGIASRFEAYEET